MNAKLENDLKIINSYVVCHYGVDDQQWGKHDPKRRWQRHAKYAMGRPDPKSSDSGGKSKQKKPVTGKNAADAFKKAEKEREKANELKKKIATLQKSLNEHSGNEKRLQEQYERYKEDPRTLRQKRGDLKREQKLRYKDYKKRSALRVYHSIRKLVKDPHQATTQSTKIKTILANARAGRARNSSFRSALALDKTLSKRLFEKSFSDAEYRAAYDRTRDVFKEIYGDTIADIMRPKL